MQHLALSLGALLLAILPTTGLRAATAEEAPWYAPSDEVLMMRLCWAA